MALLSRLPNLLFRVVPVTGSQVSAQWGERVPVSRPAQCQDGIQKAGTSLLAPVWSGHKIGRFQKVFCGQEVVLTPGCGLQQAPPASCPPDLP